MVTNNCRTCTIFGPVAAGRVAARRGEVTRRIRARQDVMFCRPNAALVDFVAVLIQPRIVVDVDVFKVQRIHVCRNQLALDVVPWARTDAIARIHAICDLRGATAAVNFHARA